MFDELIKHFLHEARSNLPTIVHLSLPEIEARFREPGRAPLDFRRETTTDQKVVITIKPRAETLRDRAAGVSGFAVWTPHGLSTDLYSIRVVNSGPWEWSRQI
jgi:hypothetical protein